MNREDRRKLSIQYAIARVKSARAAVNRQNPSPLNDIRLFLDRMENEIKNIESDDDKHDYSGGISCDCSNPFGAEEEQRANPDCAECGGAGIITKSSMMKLAGIKIKEGK